MKKLFSVFLMALTVMSCEIEQVSKEQKLNCSVQATTLLLPVGNSKTTEIKGVFTSKELVDRLKGYDMYLINCIAI